MARIKHTKTELKAQRDAQRRYKRFLPTLQLKKQQLQLELRNLEAGMREKEKEEKEARDRLRPWVQMFTESFDFRAHLSTENIVTTTGNIAGVNIPVLDRIDFEMHTPDLLSTPPWVDDGIRALRQLTHRRIERHVMQQQHDLLSYELRVTTQRVNLFEKVKIPETIENIRVIRIFLGDVQTADVVRSKLAKSKSPEQSPGEEEAA